MRVDHYTGRVTVDLGEEEVVLCFTWRVLAAFQSAFGPEWDTRLEAALMSRDTEAIAGFLAVATDKPIDWWLDREPAPRLVPVINAVQAALMAAYFGPDNTPPVPRKATAKTATVAMWWRRLIGRGAPREAIRARSGT